MLQTVMQLSLMSRTTSYSTSFHPRRSASTSTCGDDANALRVSSRSCSSFSAKPLPRPPSAYAARHITGYPITFATSTQLSMSAHASPCANGWLISVSLRLNKSRSSVAMIDSTDVPSTRTS
jgi:hypothetical protein